MSKFKKGDWVREDDALPGDEMHVHGYRIHDVLPNDQYVLEMNEDDFRVTSESYLSGCVAEPRCTGWDWVLPEPANRFGLKVGDTVTIGTHDGKVYSTVKGSYKITAIDDDYGDGIARFSLEGLRGKPFHPYWFGLCQSDGSPLPEKPATRMIVVEEWCNVQSGTARFDWHIVGNRFCTTDTWFKTGVTRELEVPNVPQTE